MPAPMLEASGLTMRYGALTALDGLDLVVDRGEVFCLLGANGAGKTTTINLFLDFVRPSAGIARVGGLNVAEHPLETKRHLAYLPEQVMLYRTLTGLENLRYFSVLGGGREYSERELIDFCRQVGLPEDAARRRVGTYSKGMRQKVGLAVALARRAEALLLDEPTSGLDPKAASEFCTRLSALAASGVAVLMATHDLFRAKETGTRVGIMKRGRLVTTLETGQVGHADLERIYLEHMHD
jgi:ABC-2 type transport system ATP-binding protein